LSEESENFLGERPLVFMLLMVSGI
jgi:hypothetical protein